MRLPPTFTDEGVRAAIEARRRHPGLGILMLSQYVEPAYTAELRRLFGDDVKAREAGHQRVKKWAARIEGAKP